MKARVLLFHIKLQLVFYSIKVRISDTEILHRDRSRLYCQGCDL